MEVIMSDVGTETDKVSYQELTWLSALVEEAKQCPYGQMAKIMIIDEEKAKRIMETNIDNRGLKRTIIERINRDIINETYYLNGEAIIISNDGRLLDGQHRIESVMETKISITTWVIIGVPYEYRTTFDQGTSKTVADYLKMDKVISSKNVAVSLKLLLTYKLGLEVTHKDLANRRWSRQELLTYYDTHSEYIQYALKTFGQNKFTKVTKSISSIVAAHVLISREVPEKIVDTFFDTLTGTGANIESTNPILWLRNKLGELSDTRKKIESHSEYKLNFILRTWNAWIIKKKVSKLRVINFYPKILKSDQNDDDVIETDEDNSE
jgi:hypothetical protein